jgi:hypothetical protein
MAKTTGTGLVRIIIINILSVTNHSAASVTVTARMSCSNCRQLIWTRWQTVVNVFSCIDFDWICGLEVPA